MSIILAPSVGKANWASRVREQPEGVASEAVQSGVQETESQNESRRIQDDNDTRKLLSRHARVDEVSIIARAAQLFAEFDYFPSIRFAAEKGKDEVCQRRSDASA